MFHFKGFFKLKTDTLHLFYHVLKAKTDLAFLDLNYIGNMYYLVLTKSYAQYLLSSLSAKLIQSCLEKTDFSLENTWNLKS